MTEIADRIIYDEPDNSERRLFIDGKKAAYLDADCDVGVVMDSACDLARALFLAVDQRDAAATRAEAAEARVAELEDLLRDVRYRSGVELDDERLGYVPVQIDRVVWDAIAATVAAEEG